MGKMDYDWLLILGVNIWNIEKNVMCVIFIRTLFYNNQADFDSGHL
jgi:hypothetical protein